MALGIRRRFEARETARKYAAQLVEQALNKGAPVDVGSIARKCVALELREVQHIVDRVRGEYQKANDIRTIYIEATPTITITASIDLNKLDCHASETLARNDKEKGAA